LPTRDFMFCSPETDTEIFLIINRLINKKSPEPDNIGPRLLKEIIVKKLNSLKHLVRTTLAESRN